MNVQTYVCILLLEVELVCNITNPRDSVSLGFPNTEKRVENTTRSGVFLMKFEVFGCVWIADETLSRVFDMIFSIKTKAKRVNGVVKSTKSMLI